MESSAVVKAFALLEASASVPSGLALGDLAAIVGLNKPTAHRILKTLSALGYVEKSGFGQYRQTAQVRRLIGPAEDERLLTAAGPYLQRLHRDTQETINLGVLRSGRIVYLEVLESPQPLRRVATPNSVDPFFSTALGRAIVALLSTPQRDLLLASGPWQPRTASTLVDPEALRAELSRVARQGYALEKDQTDVGVTCIGVPILNSGSPIAAVSVSLPSARADSATETKLVEAVRATARKIERQLTSAKEPTR